MIEILATVLEWTLTLCFSKLQLLKRWGWSAERTYALVKYKAAGGSVLFSCGAYPGFPEQGQQWSRGRSAGGRVALVGACVVFLPIAHAPSML